MAAAAKMASRFFGLTAKLHKQYTASWSLIQPTASLAWSPVRMETKCMGSVLNLPSTDPSVSLGRALFAAAEASTSWTTGRGIGLHIVTPKSIMLVHLHQVTRLLCVLKKLVCVRRYTEGLK
jgi:hypothetical protein